MNPTVHDMEDLAEDYPDSLRICMDDEFTHIIGIASGYGNTHNSIIRELRHSSKEMTNWFVVIPPIADSPK